MGSQESHTYFSLCKYAEFLLNPVLGADSRFVAEQLIMSVFDLDKSSLIARFSESVDSVGLVNFFQKLERLKSNEPLAYVLGSAWFYGSEYVVRPGVLIPRPETEGLIDRVVSYFSYNGWNEGVILELGFGSGVISLELAKKLSQVSIMGWDISELAYDVANLNKERFNTTNVSFFKGDFFESKIWEKLDQKPLVIVSNPPYIPEADIQFLDKSVRDFEPETALSGGKDGLDYYRNLKHLLPFCDAMFCEIGYDLKTLLRDLYSDYLSKISFEKDFSDLDRYFSYIK